MQIIVAPDSRLNQIAKTREQKLSQISLAWCLRRKEIASVIIGVSKLDQLKENLNALNNLGFSEECLKAIDESLINEA